MTIRKKSSSNTNPFVFFTWLLFFDWLNFNETQDQRALWGHKRLVRLLCYVWIFGMGECVGQGQRAMSHTISSSLWESVFTCSFHYENSSNASFTTIVLDLKALADNGSNGFLVGSKLTLADVGLFECVLAIEEQLGASTLDNFLEIKVTKTVILFG